jgi:uncharacterized protein YecE (DUF72 family)
MTNKVGKIIIGTSGFSYPDWKGVFYPPGLKKEDWLKFYAEHYEFCELNFSYYRMPQVQHMEKFLSYPLKFAVKAHKSMTHDRLETKAARQDFFEAVKVLQQNDHLAAVLLQFPFSFAYTPENRMYLLGLLEDLDTLPLVVEFRHPDWVRNSVFEELKKHSWGISMLDSPQISGGMPEFDSVTSDIAYLRFHGRNKENWWQGDNVSRYDYEYHQKELEAWLPRISSMAQQAKTSYISFNNHARGQAIKNANQLKIILKKAELI